MEECGDDGKAKSLCIPSCESSISSISKSSIGSAPGGAVSRGGAAFASFAVDAEDEHDRVDGPGDGVVDGRGGGATACEGGSNEAA